MMLDINRKLLARSSRVKAIDFHPTEPWIIAGLYTGNVFIWNYETGVLVKTFEVTEVPIRSVAFIARKNWFVCGADDFHLRVYNYNTQERVAAFEAHPDYIRCLVVHPSQSLVITGSDDMTIKLWDWERAWNCVQTFEGHTHYIMKIAFNPRDINQFASACLDRTVKVWSLGSSTANFTLDAHDKGVNYVEYYHGAEKPYLITCGDDKLIKVWDYYSKSCIQVLEGHSSNVSFAIFHPSLPIIVSGSEDGTVKIWHASTYRLENTLNYGLARCWCVANNLSGNDVAFGFDEGAVVIKLGKEVPPISMDTSGKVVFARHSDVVSTNLHSTASEDQHQDGKFIITPLRDLGHVEIFPQSLEHSPNGRFVSVLGDGEYIIYTALAWRNKAFGAGVGFAWSADSNTYAVLQDGQRKSSSIKVFRNFKERPGLIDTAKYLVSNIWSGALLGVRGPGFVSFHDWDNGHLVRRIEVDAVNVWWSPSGEQVAIATLDTCYILRFNRDAYLAFVDDNGDLGDEGVEEAFEVITEVNEHVLSGKWVKECFMYTTTTNRLSYLIGSTTHLLAHEDSPIYLLGYLQEQNRVFVYDIKCRFKAYAMAMAVIEYQFMILKGDMKAAEAYLPDIPVQERNRVAKFLDEQGHKTLAMSLSTDADFKFDLALSMEDLPGALEILGHLSDKEPGGATSTKWRLLGDKALALWDYPLAIDCYTKGQDLDSLLLIYTSLGDKAGLATLADTAAASGQNNIAFSAYFLVHNVKACVDVLIKTGRLPEAAFFARTFAPSEVTGTVQAWKAELENSGKHKIALALADGGAHDREESESKLKAASEVETEQAVTPAAT